MTSLVGRSRALWPGALLPLLIALAATFVSEHYGGPQLLYALFFGLAFHFLYQDPRCKPGIEFCTRTLLRIGVALLGARITVAQIGDLGVGPPAVAVLGIASTILLGAWAARRLGLKADFGLLSGTAVAICGASAALAVSAIMPKTEQSERQTLLAVVGVTGFSTLAMIFYPMLAKALSLGDTGAGVFLGGTIHDVAQVIGAGLIVSPAAADTAVVVKLFRVALLVPVVAVLACYWNACRDRSPTSGERASLLPPFLLGFMLLVLANSAGVIAPAMIDRLGQVSRLCLLVAISALGIKSSFEELASLGWRPVALMAAETLWLASLFGVYLVFLRR